MGFKNHATIKFPTSGYVNQVFYFSLLVSGNIKKRCFFGSTAFQPKKYNFQTCFRQNLSSKIILNPYDVIFVTRVIRISMLPYLRYDSPIC